MRGYFLCVILFNHLQYYPNFLTPLTGQGLLYASTAEGFFAVSGIVLGIVRGRKLLDKPFRTAATMLWKRALQLYVASVIITLIFTTVGQPFLQNEGLKYGIYTNWSDMGGFLWQTLTLSYNYGWADFLRYYTLFLFGAPLALWLLRKGYWYVLLALNLFIWSLYPVYFSTATTMQPVSWQLVFFASFIIGYYWEPLVARWKQLAPELRRAIAYTCVATFVATLIASFVIVFGATWENETGARLLKIHREVEPFFNKDQLPLARIALGTIWFWGIFIIVRKFEAPIDKWSGWLLKLFGTHSLYVYIVSAFVIFGMHLVVPAMSLENRIANLSLSLLALALVWIATKKRFLAKIIPR